MAKRKVLAEQGILDILRGDAGDLFLTGVFLQANTVNANNRVYPEEVLDEATARYQRDYIDRDRALGELNHSNEATVNPERSAIKIEELTKDGINYIGRARVLDTPLGRIVRSLVEADVQLGVSSKGIGTAVEDAEGISVIQDDFVLTTAADVVFDPAVRAAFPDAVYEDLRECISEGNEKGVKDIMKTKQLLTDIPLVREEDEPSVALDTDQPATPTDDNEGDVSGDNKPATSDDDSNTDEDSKDDGSDDDSKEDTPPVEATDEEPAKAKEGEDDDEDLSKVLNITKKQQKQAERKRVGQYKAKLEDELGLSIDQTKELVALMKDTGEGELDLDKVKDIIKNRPIESKDDVEDLKSDYANLAAKTSHGEAALAIGINPKTKTGQVEAIKNHLLSKGMIEVREDDKGRPEYVLLDKEGEYWVKADGTYNWEQAFRDVAVELEFLVTSGYDPSQGVKGEPVAEPPREKTEATTPIDTYRLAKDKKYMSGYKKAVKEHGAVAVTHEHILSFMDAA